jgi:serine protease AprX
MQVQPQQNPQWQALHQAHQRHAGSQATNLEPKDRFESQQPEAMIQGWGQASIHTPVELTPLAYALPRPADRIDSIKEVLSVQEVWNMGITGKGVTVAVIDTGVAPHPDLGDRLIEFKDFCNGQDGVENAYDDNGHGSHCAGLVAGDGSKAGGKFKGPAYEANIVGVKVLGGSGGGSLSNIERGIRWCIANKDRLGIKILSMSLGANANLHEKHDVIAQAVNEAIAAGLMPIIAAGNSGPGIRTIGTPAITKDALTVGAYDDKNTASHDDDTMAFFSSRGPTTRDGLVKPDIAAPGVNMVSLLAPNSELQEADVTKMPPYYVLLSGTSMATPTAAGCAALVMQANPDLTPAQVKQIMIETSEGMKDTPGILGGAGLVDPAAAVRKALDMKRASDQEKAKNQAA